MLDPADPTPSPEEPRRSRLRRFAPVVAVVLALVLVYGAFQAATAARAAQRGRAALTSAESNLDRRQFDKASADLTRAVESFRAMRGNLDALGPLLPVARSIPFVRIQVKGVESFARVGELLGVGGLDVITATRAVSEPEDRDRRAGQVLGALREVHRAVAKGVATLDTAVAEVDELRGYRLIGPLDTVRDQLVDELPRTRGRAVSAEEGLSAILAVAGDAGPRRYLVFSQNPDEIRPTGGFIGSYGVLATSESGIEMERFASIESWYRGKREAVVPEAEAATVFRLADAPQSIANVGATPDWPAAAQLATELWQRGGEAPVDGVISITPDFLAKLLRVLGPVTLPSYEEKVTARNLVKLSDFYTHEEELLGVDRPREDKQFVVELAEVVVRRLLEAPASSWEQLGHAMYLGFEAREALAWTTDTSVNEELADRRWDGVLPDTAGDFHYQSEFAFESKNSRGIRRAFTREVEIRADGSGLVTTTVDMANTDPPSPYNKNSLSYIVVYGPTGAELVTPSDPDAGMEDTLRGHPAAAWVRSAEPLGSTDLTVAWEVPGLLRQLDGETWAYSLYFMGAPGHTGDTLDLQVALPEGWSWQADAPPTQVSLDEDLVGTWIIQAPPGG